ncbi:unnamed protein product [Trichobilharzia regenti]|nr:unnamed protein product [Trichobilharzia regenti]
MHTNNVDCSVCIYYIIASNSVICVGRVFALDLDSGLNGTVIYERDASDDFKSSSMNDDGFFVVEQNGWICTKDGVPPVGEYRMKIFARDQGEHPVVRMKKEKGEKEEEGSAIIFIRILPLPSSDTSESSEVHYIKYTSTPPPASHTIDDNTIVGEKLFSFAVHDSYDPSGMGLVFELLSKFTSFLIIITYYFYFLKCGISLNINV